MSIVLCHKAALKTLLLNRDIATELRHCFPNTLHASEAELKMARAQLKLGDSPLDLLTTTKNQRFHLPSSQHIHYAQNITDIPAFIRMDDIYVASPELCFVQFAATLPLVETILFGYYLCGDYRPSAERAITGNQPLTSANKLASFIDSLPQMKGKVNAARAVRYLIDNSNSPQESRLTIIIILPHRLGGYGLLRPQLNQTIPGTTKIGDLCWIDQGLILEYDSAENHSNINQRQADSIRRAKIELQDFSVLSVEPQQTHSLNYLDELATLVARHLGQQVRIRTARYAQKHSALHQKLYGTAELPF